MKRILYILLTCVGLGACGAPAVTPAPAPVAKQWDTKEFTQLDPRSTHRVHVRAGGVQLLLFPPGTPIKEQKRRQAKADYAVNWDISRLTDMLDAYADPAQRPALCAKMTAHFDEGAVHIEGLGEAPQRGMDILYNDVCIKGIWPISDWYESCIQPKWYPGDHIELIIRYWQNQKDYKDGFVTRIATRQHVEGLIADHQAYDVAPQAVVDGGALSKYCKPMPPFYGRAYRPKK